MTQIYGLATLWLGLALLATMLSIWLRIATAMSEIIVGTVVQLIIGAVLGAAALGTDESWVRFLASIGAVVLTFLAGAELDPQVMRREWKQATVIGLVAFAAPFLGCAAVARYLIGWDPNASWLTGIALSTTSVAVVYAVMLEFGLKCVLPAAPSRAQTRTGGAISTFPGGPGGRCALRYESCSRESCSPMTSPSRLRRLSFRPWISVSVILQSRSSPPRRSGMPTSS